MASVGIAPTVPEYAHGGFIEGGLAVADIWAAFPNLAPEVTNLLGPQEIAEAQRQFASDVRIAAKRNREDAAYDRIQELQ